MSGAFGSASVFAKIVIVLAIAFLVGLGLCGLSFVVASHGYQSHEEFGVDTLGIAGFSLIVMVLSAVGLVATVVVRVVVAIFRSMSSKGEGGEPQTLFEKEDDEQKPK
jgi:hypothetical protein